MYLRALAVASAKRLEIRALPVNRGRGLERRNLVGEQGRAAPAPATSSCWRVAIGDVGGGERLRLGQRVSADGIGLGVQNLGQLRLFRADDFFIIARHLHRRMNVLQSDEKNFHAQFVRIGGGLDLSRKVSAAASRPCDMTSFKSTPAR